MSNVFSHSTQEAETGRTQWVLDQSSLQRKLQVSTVQANTWGHVGAWRSCSSQSHTESWWSLVQSSAQGPCLTLWPYHNESALMFVVPVALGGCETVWDLSHHLDYVRIWGSGCCWAHAEVWAATQSHGDIWAQATAACLGPWSCCWGLCWCPLPVLPQGPTNNGLKYKGWTKLPVIGRGKTVPRLTGELTLSLIGEPPPTTMCTWKN